MFEFLDEDPRMQWTVENLQVLNRLMDCVRRGDTEEMKDLVRQKTPDLEVRLASDEIRHVKDLVIILIQMLSLAGNSGGLPEMLVLRLKEQYIFQLEKLDDIRSVSALADQVKMDFCRYVHELRSPSVSDARIRRAVNHIDGNCTKSISLKELSDLAGVTREHFTRLFREETGMTAGEYIRRRRIEIAKQMLMHTDMSISRISAYLSFSSQPYFQKVFKEETGVTPLSFRKHSAQYASDQKTDRTDFSEL